MKRRLIIAVIPQLLLWVFLLPSMFLPYPYDDASRFFALGLVSVLVAAAWSPLLRFVLADQAVQRGVWFYGWAKRFLACFSMGCFVFGLGVLREGWLEPSAVVAGWLWFLPVMLLPGFYRVEHKRTDQPPLLHEELFMLSLALLGAGLLAANVIGMLAPAISFETCAMLPVPAMLAFLVALVVWGTWRERQAHPNVPEHSGTGRQAPKQAGTTSEERS